MEWSLETSRVQRYCYFAQIWTDRILEMHRIYPWRTALATLISCQISPSWKLAFKASPLVYFCETVPGRKGMWLWRLYSRESSARGAEGGTKLRLSVRGYLYAVVLREIMS